MKGARGLRVPVSFKFLLPEPILQLIRLYVSLRLAPNQLARPSFSSQPENMPVVPRHKCCVLLHHERRLQQQRPLYVFPVQRPLLVLSFFVSERPSQQNPRLWRNPGHARHRHRRLKRPISNSPVNLFLLNEHILFASVPPPQFCNRLLPHHQ